jgi:hypothetical protein
MTTPTPNMALTLPVVSQTPGPTWASEINADLSLIDSHNHTSGNGALVPVAGLNINADLPLANNALTNVKSLGLLDQASVATLRAIYSKGGNLYWRSGGNAEVQLTLGGAINVASVNGITGMIPSCSVVFDPSPDTYTFRDDSANFATLVGLAIKFGSVGSTLFGGGNVSVQLPSALPATAVSPITFGSFMVATQSGGGSVLSYLNAANGITRNMQAAVGQEIQTSNSSDSVSTSVETNLSDSITITTTGRPVILGIKSGGVGSCLEILANAAGVVGGQVFFNVTGTVSDTRGRQDLETTLGNGEYFRIPASSVSDLWPAVAGTYTIRLRGSVKTGGSYVSATLTARLIQIYAYEL